MVRTRTGAEVIELRFVSTQTGAELIHWTPVFNLSVSQKQSMSETHKYLTLRNQRIKLRSYVQPCLLLKLFRCLTGLLLKKSAKIRPVRKTKIIGNFF